MENKDTQKKKGGDKSERKEGTGFETSQQVSGSGKSEGLETVSYTHLTLPTTERV